MIALAQALDDIIQLDPGLRSLTESDVDDIVEGIVDAVGGGVSTE